MLLTTSAPSALAVSLAEAKAHCRIDSDVDDALVERQVRAAMRMLEVHTGIRTVPVSLQWRQSGWCRGIELPGAPVRDVTAVTYLDADNAEQTLSTASWYWRRTVSGALVEYDEGVSLPALSRRAESVRVDFAAGYDDPSASGSGDDAMTIPDERVVHAIKLLVGHWYENREAVVLGGSVHTLPDGYRRLAEQLRVRW